ncbi:enoyl-CoA hydratase [Polymorphobacter glacialis]|uniref:Enoyl-CoA hydratase n=2 Tax=Sandarakinorhabdus glacialis TaxID=1614636 RepID=A0A916ZYQ1_9SPHN|nr:enoyl-CoA hydratase [Polymorphobacter glacialis]
MSNYSDILYAVDAGVATITLNRPDRLNAWCASLDADVRAGMRAATDDPAVRVIVLTGAGRGFCAGADMNVLQGIQDGDTSTRPTAPETPWDTSAHPDFQKQYSWFPAVPKPIIGAINGPCAGLGMVLALYTDIRIASDLAVFSTAFARRGLIAEHGISWLLPRLIGMANAAEILFSARRIEAAEARSLGLVNRVVPHANFATEVQSYARMLAVEVSPRSLAAMKREIWNAQLSGLGAAIDAANIDMKASFATDDFKEGVAHYLEKRPAAFSGR